MKHKTWFRLVLKAIGVLVFGLSIAPLAAAIGQITFMYANQGPASFNTTMQVYGWMAVAGHVLQLLLGLYLFFGGKWIVNLAIPSNRPYCPECGYDLSNARGERCPECGIALPRSE